MQTGTVLFRARDSLLSRTPPFYLLPSSGQFDQSGAFVFRDNYPDGLIFRSEMGFFLAFHHPGASEMPPELAPLGLYLLPVPGLLELLLP